MLLWLEPPTQGLSTSSPKDQGSSEVSGALPDSTHLEAEFRLVGHIMLHAARNGFSRTIVRGNDTDICIILLAYLPTLLQCNSDYKLLFDCGTGASRFMFNINHIGDRIGVGALPATAICVLFERL